MSQPETPEDSRPAYWDATVDGTGRSGQNVPLSEVNNFSRQSRTPPESRQTTPFLSYPSTGRTPPGSRPATPSLGYPSTFPIPQEKKMHEDDGTNEALPQLSQSSGFFTLEQNTMVSKWNNASVTKGSYKTRKTKISENHGSNESKNSKQSLFDTLDARRKELKPVSLVKLKNRTIDEIRGQREPIKVPQYLQDKYNFLSTERELVLASRWDLLKSIRKKLKQLPKSFSFKRFISQIMTYADNSIIDASTFAACAKAVYRISEAWVFDEIYEKVRAKKLSWKHIGEEVIKDLNDMFPMWAMEIGKGEYIQRYLDVRDLKLAWMFFEEKEKTLYLMLEEAVNLYDRKESSVGEPCIGASELARILALPTVKLKDLEFLYGIVGSAFTSRPVKPADPVKMLYTRGGLKQLLLTSILSRLFVSTSVTSDGIRLLLIESMYAPILRKKLTKRRTQHKNIQKAVRFRLKRYCRGVIKQWKRRIFLRKLLRHTIKKFEHRKLQTLAIEKLQHWSAMSLEYRAATSIQAAWVGRKVRIAFFRAAQARFLAGQLELWWHWHKFGREEHREGIRKNDVTIQLQKLVRGVLARKDFMRRGLAVDPPIIIALRIMLRRRGIFTPEPPLAKIQGFARIVIAKNLTQILRDKRDRRNAQMLEENRLIKEQEKELRKKLEELDSFIKHRFQSRQEKLEEIKAQLETKKKMTTLAASRRMQNFYKRRDDRRNEFEETKIKRIKELNDQWKLIGGEKRVKAEEYWTNLIFYKRPPAGDPQRKEFDEAKYLWSGKAEELALERQNHPDMNAVDAKNWFIQQKIREAAGPLDIEMENRKHELTRRLRDETQALKETEEIEHQTYLKRLEEIRQNFFLLIVDRGELLRYVLNVWIKGYSIESGNFFWYHQIEQRTTWAKPMLLGWSDVGIPHRWEKQVRHGLIYFFNPATHEYSLDPPEKAIMCINCDIEFAVSQCQQGCGEMCSRCWDILHFQSEDHEMSRHVWLNYDGAAV